MEAPDSIAHVAQLLDALNCAAAIINRDGRVIHANDPLCEATGRQGCL